MAEDLNARAEAAVPKFRLQRVLNQALYGTIEDQPAVLVVERAPFPTSEAYLGALPSSLARLCNLGANDIYSWSMARAGGIETDTNDDAVGAGDAADGGATEGAGFVADLKINLIWPCTEAHVKKYSKQGVRLVTETPEIYREAIQPWVRAKRERGALNWVYNIIEGKKEADDVIYRTPRGEAGDEGFLLLPDLNWDRRTLEGLHLLGVVERRDIWSLRDLRKKHVSWLRHMRERLVAATVGAYPAVEADQLKLYVHYQPTYYHFHIHIVHVALEAGATQATGKAVGLESIIETLRVMDGGEDGDEAGMDKVALSYTVGEASELWTDVFEPLRTGRGRASR
ncbi:m7GpppX diphosphatase [Escovopsis weberi]|uniref:M7GpppX diphosphatase n=1 Tax=Escovopsis weberi TaxID=150374 RepID=A0A0M9VSS1_ESCWE|nr:m7GpppX diphosphatase [Escovopsis weberi]